MAAFSDKTKKEFIRDLKFSEKVMIQRIMNTSDTLFAHMELAAENGQIDFERGKKIARTELAQARKYVEAVWDDREVLEEQKVCDYLGY